MAAPSVSVTPFGEYKGQVVRQYVLCNGHGMSASIITYGAILRKLEVPGKTNRGNFWPPLLPPPTLGVEGRPKPPGTASQTGAASPVPHVWPAI